MVMNILGITNSKTRQAILGLFLLQPERAWYLREMAQELSLSVGNIRRELLSLTKIGLFTTARQGRLIYYKVNVNSPYWELIGKTMVQKTTDIIKDGLKWVTESDPSALSNTVFCETRDVFNVRLEKFVKDLELALGQEAYLLGGVVGEIGNNSYDHNLGNWPNVLGIYFAHDVQKRTVVLADRGLGILATIKNVRPNTQNESQALKTAFTEIISGRLDLKRGNGLKFVKKTIVDKNWKLEFYSGNAKLTITGGKIIIKISEMNVYGCLAVILY